MSVTECRQRAEEIERAMEMIHDKKKTQAMANEVKRIRDYERRLLADARQTDGRDRKDGFFKAG